MTLHVMRQRFLEAILDKAGQGNTLSYQEIVHLLTLQNPADIQKVMEAARRLREKHFGNRLFLYGFIYFSTYCRNHCSFCFYRKTNKLSPRYRKSKSEVVEIAAGLADSGVHLIDLTMGEDPEIHDAGNYEILYEMVRGVKDATGLPVMISPGVVPDEVLSALAAINVDWYALYQETHNPNLYSKLRIGQSFEERISRRNAAHKSGMLVEDGMLLGTGETTGDRANSINIMRRSGVHQARVMSLVPQLQTPLAGRVPVSRINEYLIIAVMRLVMPDTLIPASLDVDGINGLRQRLEAGANVITSIIPPHSHLAGVSQSSLDIEQGLRTVPEVKKVLASMGLQAAEARDYTQWVSAMKQSLADWGENRAESRYCGRTASGLGGGVPG